MAKASNMNGNGYSAAGKFVREFGLPTALLFALGWVSVNYWIAPQTDLIKAMTEASQTMADTYKSLDAGMKANHSQLQDILEETQQTTKAVESAYELMKDVPAQRDREISVAQETCDLLKTFTTGVVGQHKTQLDNQGKIIEKLDQGGG